MSQREGGLGAVVVRTGEGSVRAVASWRAPAIGAIGAGGAGLAGEGRAGLAAFEAVRLIRRLERAADRAALVALYGLASGEGGAAPKGFTDAALSAAIIAAVESGKVRLLTGGSDDATRGPSDARDTPARRLLVAVMDGRDSLTFRGTRYKLVATDGQRQARGLGRYRPVQPHEARDLLRGLAELNAKTPAARAQWKELGEMAAARGEPGPTVVLLRLRDDGVTYTATDDAPPETPSQLRKQNAPKAWVQIEVLFDDGTPYAGNCVVELPDGRTTEGAPDDKGVIRIDGFDPGSCKLSFPDLDASAWKTA